MPIFDDLASRRAVWPASAVWPRRRADRLIARFQHAFPRILYDLYWETRVINAQAFIDDLGPRVRMYGGLARHRRIGFEGIAFALAHETGHHLAGPPYHPSYRVISSEGRADQWALCEGLQAVFGSTNAVRIGARGVAQIRAITPRLSGFCGVDSRSDSAASATVGE